MVNYAGRLSLFYNQWSFITNDPVVLSYIQGYEIPFSRPVTQHCAPSAQIYVGPERTLCCDAINNLLAIGAVSICEPCDGQYISKFFLIPKPNGKTRFILNLKSLNKFIETQHFKLEDL